MNYIRNGYSRHMRGKQGGTPKATEKAQFCRFVHHVMRIGMAEKQDMCPGQMEMPGTGSCMGWDAENGEENLVTMDVRERKGRARDHRPEGAAKRQGDPWGPRNTRNGEKRKRERSRAQGFAVDVVPAFDATFQNSASKHPTFGVKITVRVRDSARGERVHIVEIGPKSKRGKMKR